jgi:hypothetical protein
MEFGDEGQKRARCASGSSPRRLSSCSNREPEKRAWTTCVTTSAEAYGKIGGCPMGSLANERAPYRRSHRTDLTAGFQAWAGEIERALLALQACGALSAKFDPKSLSLLFLSTIRGGLLFAKLNGSAEALAKGLDQLIALIRNQE